jgi:hypothetical protein
MKANSLSVAGSNMTTIILALLGAYIIIQVLAGRKLPLIPSERAALIILLVIGMAMCGLSGINRVSAAGAWAHPLAIIAYILGALILVVAAAGIFGIRLPMVPDAHAAIVAVAILTTAKLVIGILHRFV